MGSVSTVVHGIADSVGTPITEQESVVGKPRGGRLRPIVALMDNITGRALHDDMDTFRAKSAAGDIRIIVYHRGGQAGEIRIVPDAHTSSIASKMRKEILNALPGIRCTID